LAEAWIINASPVITLAKAGYLHLLDQLAIEILIPRSVVDEILAGPFEDPARQAIESGWGDVLSPGLIPEIVLEWGLGAGESAVLAAALAEPGRMAVLDDAAARACARTLGIPYLGTLAIILRSKQAGLLESAATAMHALRQAGLRLDDQTLRRAMGQIDESWPG